MTTTAVPQVQITARDYYVLKKGIPLGAAIALVSVLYHESRLSPKSQGYQSTEHGGILNPHGAFGAASWNGPEDQTKIGDPVYDRQAALLAFSKQHGLDVGVLETQLAFVLTEIANRYPGCWAAIRSTASYQGVITVLTNEYEIPANKPAEIADSLKIAEALAMLPPPKEAPTAPVTQTPATQMPIPAAPSPAPPAGLPPISGMEAGMDAALRDHMGKARDALVNQREVIDKRIAWIDASIGEFEKLSPAPTTQLISKPITPPPPATELAATPQTQGTQNMPAIFSALFGNWKTTLSGVVAAAGQGVAAKYPEYAPLAQWLSAAGMAALGLTATDAKTK